MYRNSDLQEEKVRILRALGSTARDDLLQKTLQFSISVCNKNFDLFTLQDL